MNRAEGVSKSKAGWITRLIYRNLEKRLGLISKTKALAAHHTPTLLAWTWMDRISGSAETVPFALKELAQLKVAAVVGCPF